MSGNILTMTYFGLRYYVAYVMFHDIYICVSLFLSSLFLILIGTIKAYSDYLLVANYVSIDGNILCQILLAPQSM